MNTDIDLMLSTMKKAFHDFENAMPDRPTPIQLSFGQAYRFEEKNIYEAIIQKLARLLSAINATKLLLEAGFLQEQAILHRVLDETNEDILFLVYAVTNGEITELHERYLEAFWQEEIDHSGNMLDSEQNRPMIPRKKIQAYLAKIEGISGNPSSNQEALRTISKAYSGFVHGASPHIMDMYVGNPPRFQANGVRDPIRIEEHTDDFWNYVYRSFVSHVSVAKAIGAQPYIEKLTNILKIVESNAGIRK